MTGLVWTDCVLKEMTMFVFGPAFYYKAIRPLLITCHEPCHLATGHLTAGEHPINEGLIGKKTKLKRFYYYN